MTRIIFIVVITGLVILVFILLFFYVIKARNEKGYLQVTSLPKSKVYLDGKYVGDTPFCKCDAQNTLSTGDYTIRLVPSDNILSEFQEKINIFPSVLTVVDRKFGPGAENEGYIISLAPLSDKKNIELLVTSFPEKSDIYLDNNMIGSTPLLLKSITDSDHALTLRKNGYNEKTLRIHTPSGYQLNATVYLGVKKDAASQDNGQAATASASVIISPTLSPSAGASKVVILNTPTGFLRVHENNSLGSPEIARVSPGDSFPLLDEQNGWYAIKLSDGSQGWISAQYAKKQ